MFSVLKSRTPECVWLFSYFVLLLGSSPSIVFRKATVHVMLNMQNQTLMEAMFCAMKSPAASSFCRQDLPSFREHISKLAINQKSLCPTSTHRVGPSVSMTEFRNNKDNRLWSSYCKYMHQNESILEGEREYSNVYPTAMISYVDHMSKNHRQVYMHRCETEGSMGDFWTFEDVGPFIGQGEEWHSAGWINAGRFGESVDSGVWATAFGFRPSDEQQIPIGLPPIHIHHMHVTSSQSMQANGFIEPRRSRDGFFAIEFDVHGDRQCTKMNGGMDCTIRAFPDGYGLKLTDQMETFFDLKDVRSQGSPKMLFFANYIYRWKRESQRLVGKMLTLISTESFKPHDDYLLVFNGVYKNEYLYWQEGRWIANASIVHMYWHTHHKYTEDLWVVSTDAIKLNLNETFGGMFVNLTSLGYDVVGAMEIILTQLRGVQDSHVKKQTADPAPALRCRLNRDRWENMGDEEPLARYQVPHCHQWDVREGELFTLIAFHKYQFEGTIPSEVFWMHSVLYGFYVASSARESIPHGMYYEDLMLGGISRRAPDLFQEHSGWWSSYLNRQA